MESFTGPVAHRIEYLPPEQGVVGSNPTGLTIKKLPIPIIRNGFFIHYFCHLFLSCPEKHSTSF